MPASAVDQRGHEAALLPRNGAAESFVSFIPLFGGAARPPSERFDRACTGPLGLEVRLKALRDLAKRLAHSLIC